MDEQGMPKQHMVPTANYQGGNTVVIEQHNGARRKTT